MHDIVHLSGAVTITIMVTACLTSQWDCDGGEGNEYGCQVVSLVGLSQVRNNQIKLEGEREGRREGENVCMCIHKQVQKHPKCHIYAKCILLHYNRCSKH